MDFTETITLELPQFSTEALAFLESDTQGQGLIIECAAIHAGLTNNFNNYTPEALEGSLESWVSPYPKPILMHHDPHSEPIGRVMAAKMDKEADGTPYVRLQIAITDPAAAQKVLDKRYLTGSIGGKAKEAVCSICNTDWTKPKEGAGLPCRHQRGKTYKGQLMYMNMKSIEAKEYSFVNTPADTRSSVRNTGDESEAGLEWVRPAKVFSLNMDKEEVLEYTESESRDLLVGMKKKESAPLYLSLKGAFLSALAAAESDEDILSVSETLSADLAAQEDQVIEEDNEGTEDEETTHLHLQHKKDHDIHVEVGYNKAIDKNPDDQPGGTDTTAAPGTPAPSMASDDEEPTVEAEISADLQNKDDVLNSDPRVRRAEGQEKTKRHDVDPETSKGAPRSREDEEENENVEEEENTDPVETDRELDEHTSTLESTLAETQTRLNSLLDENAKLKTTLKRTLAERVVDMKIALGIAEKTTRDADLEEHTKRSASSLADSLRDLSQMDPIRQKDYSDFPTVDEAVAVPDPNKSAIMIDDPTIESTDPAQNAEDLFVDVLMGRRKL